MAHRLIQSCLLVDALSRSWLSTGRSSPISTASRVSSRGCCVTTSGRGTWMPSTTFFAADLARESTSATRLRHMGRFAEFGRRSRSILSCRGEYIDDDSGYRAWLAANPNSYVLNAHRSPKPYYLRLHRVTCRTLSPDLPANGDSWTVTYRKVCDTRSELEAWAARQVPDGEVWPCSACLD